MTEKREFPRTTLSQKAKFFGANGWEDCIITEASRKGFSVQFCNRKKINEGSIILLEVPLSSEPEPVTITGILQWIEKRGESFVGGVEWFSILKSKKGGKIQDS